MVARHFLLRHGDEQSSLDYDTDDGLEVLKFQIFSLTSVPPDEQKILIEDGNIVLTEASDLESISDKLRLVSLQDSEEGTSLGEAKGEAKPAAAASDLENSGISDEELARILQAEEEALYAQQLRAGDGKGEFEKRIRPHVSQVRMYEDYHRQQEARKTVPVDELEEKALLSLAKEGIFSPSEEETDHAFLLQLLFWFKQSFRWVNAPACDSCGSETSGFGMGAPLPAERQFDASRVELYRCNRCLKITRFPRYNDPLKLLETRRGRCGEWANCFTLYCRAFGYESRMILDFTDHVWTECFSQFLGRWTHLDPCEGIHDNPLLYEKGWNKKLSYVIAISKDGVHDVTKRYTKKWHEVLSRRNITTESSVLAVLSDITTECRRSYSSEAISVLESRDKKESEELETLHLQSSSSLSLPGRQSGSKEWRMARSELGSQISDSLSSSLCPVRTCIDNHVRNIYCSFTHLLSDFISDGLPKSVVVRYLGILKRLLLHLKSTSFKVRKTFINLSSSGSQLYKREGSSLYEFLAAISLKREELDHKFCISLAGNPVQTSLALPVALDLLDEAIDCLECVTHFDQNFLVNFSRLNRISCGSVLASGEELPFGISTSAFDGARLTKWEEPNGAKGCWLVYKIADGLMHELEAYELMSANDVPERDPMDWIVEGSEDGGANWHTLDQQTSQMFEKRFQRKRYKVESIFKCNVFRFKFVSVRDSKTNSRFQIGSIDLYARNS